MASIGKAFALFESIESTTSRTEKESLLGAANEVAKELLYLAYNPYLTFNIKKDPKVTPTGNISIHDNFNRFRELCQDLYARTITGNEALDRLKDFLSGCTEQEYKWYMKVIQKDLKIGITHKTINKVHKKYIPVFECMLAENMKESTIPKEYVADPKLDGYRCLAVNDPEKGVILRSRNGHQIFGYDNIERAIKLLPKGYIYDGEIMGRSNKFSEVQKTAFKKQADKDGVLHIFDVVSIAEFDKGKFSATYKDRLEYLDSIDDYIENSLHLERVPTSRPVDFDDLSRTHLYYTEELGYEGTMVKDLSKPYKMGKGRAVQKFKDMLEMDLVVVDVEEGKEGGKFEGTLGSLVVELSDKDIEEQLPEKALKKAKYVKDCTAKVKVGSGFSEDLRNIIWSNPGAYINKTIEIKFQETTINDDGTHSLRFPIFVRFRDDK